MVPTIHRGNLQITLRGMSYEPIDTNERRCGRRTFQSMGTTCEDKDQGSRGDRTTKAFHYYSCRCRRCACQRRMNLLLRFQRAGGSALTIFACAIPTEGVPSLRCLQEPALSLSKGWAAMFRVLFDSVVDT